ncbi:Flp pilus assembly protein CpaB [bacterium]|nr:Flp pilus assembly protein CpaB [bacterium]
MNFFKKPMKNILTPTFSIFLKSWYIPIILASLTTSLVIKKINHYKTKLQLSMQTAEVLIVNKSLFKGDIIDEDDIDITELSLKYLPSGTLTATDLNQIIGTRLNKSLAKNELILWSFLNLDSLHQLPSDQIEPGHRLIALAISSIDSMGFRIQKGDHIDLIHTAILPKNQTPSTYTLLQNVTVLGLGNYTNNSSSNQNYTTISLMVLPKEALMIKNAQENGQLSFLLRNSIDQKTNTMLPMINQDDVFEQAFRNSLQYERNKAIDLIKGNQRFTKSQQKPNFSRMP